MLNGAGPLWPAFEAMLAMERGDWGCLTRIAKDQNVNEDEIGDAHMKAIQWACQVFHLA